LSVATRAWRGELVRMPVRLFRPPARYLILEYAAACASTRIPSSPALETGLLQPFASPLLSLKFSAHLGESLVSRPSDLPARLPRCSHLWLQLRFAQPRRRTATRLQLRTLNFILGLCRRESGPLTLRLVCCSPCIFSVRWTVCSVAQMLTLSPAATMMHPFASTGSACRYSVSLSKQDTNAELVGGTMPATGIIVVSKGASPTPVCEI